MRCGKKTQQQQQQQQQKQHERMQAERNGALAVDNHEPSSLLLLPWSQLPFGILSVLWRLMPGGRGLGASQRRSPNASFVRASSTHPQGETEIFEKMRFPLPPTLARTLRNVRTHPHPHPERNLVESEYPKFQKRNFLSSRIHIPTPIILVHPCLSMSLTMSMFPVHVLPSLTTPSPHL